MKSIKRRDLLRSFGMFTASSVLGTRISTAQTGSAAKSESGRRPNILVFLSDDHAQWLQEAYGNSEVLTPNMSRIARRGVRMTNSFTTTPVCSPARASFFTGRMPSQHGIHDWIEESKQAYAYPWLKGQTLLSELLKRVGYHTGLVGKWHCGEERYSHPGFDSWFSYWVSQYPHSGVQNFSDNGKHVIKEGFQSPMLTQQAIRFLRSHYQEETTADKPFFFFFFYTDTHSPHTQMPNDVLSEYKNATFRDIPNERFSDAHGKALIPVTDDKNHEHAKLKEYYAAASSIDREVGKVLDELESLGQLNETMVIYTADHGLNAGQHGMWEKGNGTQPQNFLEESIRVPCVVSWPTGGIPKNLESNLPVNHCDLFMTVLEAANALPDQKLTKEINSPGRSYLPQLRGESPVKWKGHIICEYGNARMIRSDAYKLILRYPYQGVRFANELYDLKADPRESTNIYASTSSLYKQVKEEMSTQLDAFFAIYSVPGHDGLNLEHQPLATPQSPWLVAAKSKSKTIS